MSRAELSCRHTRRAEDPAVIIKTGSFVYICQIYAEEEQEEEDEAPGKRGGGIIKTQHVSGGIPLLREREAAGVGCEESEREKEGEEEEEEGQKIWHFACNCALFINKEE